jgi:hypothetical protein
MKTTSILLSSLSILMTLSQLICGLWIKANGAVPSSVSFHASLGIATVLVVLITIVVMLVFIVKKQPASAIGNN